MNHDKQKILVADDERFYINLLVDLLSEDYHIVIAKNGVEALKLAKDGPDLILLDILMPEMDGYEVCRQLKADEHTRGIPIIFLTIKSDLDDEIYGFKLGAIDYVSKPISPAIVKARVATHIALSNARKDLIDQNKTLVTEQLEKDEQLRRSEKMAALGKLTGGIAHDFNNILGIVLGYAELLHEKLISDKSLVKYIEHILDAGERGKNITQKLLSFSRQDSNHPEVVNINDLLEADHPMLAKTLTPSISLTLELEDEPWPVYLDKRDLQDAILNISINAMHAMPSGGSLTLQTHNEHLSTDVASNLAIQAGEYIRLSITDTGCGMNQQTQVQIFDPFFSTKGDEGTGLGMSQVYGLVKRSKGSIHIDSKVGQGTCISLYFPHYENTLTTNNGQENNLTSKPGDYSGHECILVVEDEKALVQLLEEVLKGHGYKVFCAENSDDALNVLKTNKVDLILSDVIMPGIDGYEFAAIVQKKFPDIKIQILSGFGENNCLSNSNNPLHQHRIQKPVHINTLLKRVRDLLDNY